MVNVLIFRDWKRPGKIKKEPLLLYDLACLLCMGAALCCMLLETLNSPTLTLGS